MKQKKYLVPMNFALEGKIAGIINLRNLIETIIILIAIGVPLIGYIPLPVKAKLYVCILVMIPVTLLSLRGINGLSLFSYLADVLMEQRYRKVYGQPKSSDQIMRERRLIMKKTEKLRKQQKTERKKRRDEKRSRRKAKGEDDDE